MLFLALLASLQFCTASQFAHKGDRLAGGPSRYLGRRVLPTDVGIAHRDLPQGTWVNVCNKRTGLCATGVVLDAGPYGMVDEKGWFNSALAPTRRRTLIRKVGKHKAYRGCADLTPALAQKIGHNGLEKVSIRVLGW